MSVNKGEWDNKGLKKDFDHLEWIQAVKRVLKPSDPFGLVEHITIIKNGVHLNGSAGWTSLTQCLEVLNKMMK